MIAELRALYARQKQAAAEALAMMAERPDVDQVELGYAVDDHEAQGMGWPCATAQWACLGMVAAACDRPVSLVPRGTTVATAAAADAREGAG